MPFQQDVIIGHKYTTEVFIAEAFPGGIPKSRVARSLNTSKEKFIEKMTGEEGGVNVDKGSLGESGEE